ncbi:hypothetical protein ACFQO4_15065 [Saliphagus sp. GCM10025334]
MNRRRFIVGLGSAAIASGSILTPGAFSSIEADRPFEVEVVHDNDAYLSLRQLGAGERSLEDGTPERVRFRFPSLVERVDDPDLGLGLNSEYEFVYDANEGGTKGLLRIGNQGTNTVEVHADHETSSQLEIELFDVTDPDRTALRDAPVTLSPGTAVDVGVRIETFDASVDSYEETLTIVAATPDP